MMSKHAVFPGALLRIVSLLLVFLASTHLLHAGEVEIRGTVMKVTESRVKIVCEPELVPSEGDNLRIGFELGGEFIAVEGTWEVVEARPDFSWAARKEGGVGTAAAGYMAIISSPSPKTKSEAAYLAGMKYRDGRGVETDLAEALRLFLVAARMGHASAQAEAGWAYLNGIGVEQNYPEAARWLREATDQGLDKAQLTLGFMMVNGQGMPKDEAGALALFRKAAAQGYPAAINNIGGMYEQAMGGLTRDCDEAMRWYKRSSEKGYARATMNLGRLYELGCGVRKDLRKARQLYRQAADEGFHYALYTLAESYRNEGGKKNRKKALEFYQEAAGKGVQQARDWLNANGYK
jgi:TPR repeat protein